MSRNNDRDSHLLLVQITTTGQTASVAPTMHRRPMLDQPVLPLAPAIPSLEPATPKSMTCPTPIPKGYQGRETQLRRRGGLADRLPAGCRERSRLTPGSERPWRHDLP